jgi:ATP-dependent DNA helicase DinG
VVADDDVHWLGQFHLEGFAVDEIGLFAPAGLCEGLAGDFDGGSGVDGVDVPGPALSLVVIDKLPFAPPEDPLLAARLARLKAEGGNPFRDYQLPQAAISLKQGAGRLIRAETDRGVLMICDPRLVDKPYGKVLWRSLPPMRRTREVDEAVAFFSASP